MVEVLRDIIRRNRAGAAVAIPSVCSAHPDVLRASLALAAQLDRHIVIEATSNQVNQDGGYTGMTPVNFIQFVNALADKLTLPRPTRHVPYRFLYGVGYILESIHRLFLPEREPRITRYGVVVLGRSTTLNIGKAKKELGYEPVVGVWEGLDRYVKWWGGNCPGVGGNCPGGGSIARGGDNSPGTQNY